MNAASTELSSAKAARPMPSTSLRPPHRRRVPRRPDDRKLLSAGAMRTFSSRAEHRGWLESQATLPRGFRVGVTRFEFAPVETGRTARMALSLIALDRPTEAFAGVFTRNAFPGAPVIVGRRRMAITRYRTSARRAASRQSSRSVPRPRAGSGSLRRRSSRRRPA
jgi:hypothetical protein